MLYIPLIYEIIGGERVIKLKNKIKIQNTTENIIIKITYWNDVYLKITKSDD